MLKIAEYRKVLGEDGKSIRREKIDLKELEKFGYTLEDWDNYYRKKEDGYNVQINIFDREILVYKFRENSNWGDYIGQLKEDAEKLKQYIPDLLEVKDRKSVV